MSDDRKPGLNLNQPKPAAAAPAAPATTPTTPAPPPPPVAATAQGEEPVLDVEGIQKATAEAAALAAVDRAGVAGGGEEGEVIFSSYPAPNFALGDFRFENGVLRLKGERLDQFRKLLDDPRLPAADRALIVELDIDRVDSIVESRRAAIQGGFDSAMGRASLERLHQSMPTVGTQDIAHAELPQRDNNQPLIPTEPFDPEGKTGLDQGPHTAPSGDQMTPPGPREPVGDETKQP